jgi:hypothetical protein
LGGSDRDSTEEAGPDMTLLGEFDSVDGMEMVDREEVDEFVDPYRGNMGGPSTSRTYFSPRSLIAW